MLSCYAQRIQSHGASCSLTWYHRIRSRPICEAAKSEPPWSLSEQIQDAKFRTSWPVRTMEHDPPPGDGANLLRWSDDDKDATDFKHTEDYDPWQEEDIYKSTPELDVTAEPLENLSSEDKSRIQRFVMLHREQNRKRIKIQPRSFQIRFCTVITLHLSVPRVQTHGSIP